MKIRTNAFQMAFSVLAIGFAVGATTSQAADSSSAQTPPDREKLEAAMKTCVASSGKEAGARPTEEQRASIDACMKAAGFEKPSGGPRGGHRGPPPPRDGADNGQRPPPPPEDNSAN